MNSLVVLTKVIQSSEVFCIVHHHKITIYNILECKKESYIYINIIIKGEEIVVEGSDMRHALCE